MATKAALVKRCADLGVELVADGHAADLEVLCPAGKCFEPGVHMRRIGTCRNITWKMPDAYAAMLDDLKDGVEDCTDPECGYCTEEE